MSKHYRLIVSGDSSFSLSNETDSDIQSDYSPGIWSINTQKSALKFSKQILAEGNTIEVTDYDNPRYHPIANYFIKELGLKQELFKEVGGLPESKVTNGKPSTLGAFKKYLQPGTKVRMINVTFPDRSRETFVKRVQTTSVVLDKSGGDSWLEFGKASEWTFDNEGATHHYLSREKGWEKSMRVEYLPA